MTVNKGIGRARRLTHTGMALLLAVSIRSPEGA